MTIRWRSVSSGSVSPGGTTIATHVARGTPDSDLNTASHVAMSPSGSAHADGSWPKQLRAADACANVGSPAIFTGSGAGNRMSGCALGTASWTLAGSRDSSSVASSRCRPSAELSAACSGAAQRSVSLAHTKSATCILGHTEPGHRSQLVA